VFTTSGTYPWSFVTQIFHSGQTYKTKTMSNPNHTKKPGVNSGDREG